MTSLATLVTTSEAVAGTRSRRVKVEILAGCLQALRADEIETAVAFLSGELPAGRIGLGYAAVRDVGATPAAEPQLDVLDVDRVLAAIAGLSGTGSKGPRLELLRDLLGRATAGEQRFLRRLLVGELRQGALESLMTDAVAGAAGLPEPAVRRAFMLRGRLPEVALAAIVDGAAGLGRFRLEVGRPILPMLAQSAADVTDAVGRLEEAALEWKLDGARIQVHRADDDVRVFSRRLNDVTEAVPEIVEAVGRLPVRHLVLDGEAISLRADGSPQPFQVTMRRFGRRLDVERLREQIPLAPLFFDCLHLDGTDLLDVPARERIETMDAALPNAPSVPRLVTGDVAAAEAFLESALRRGHEGIVAKSLVAAYDAGRRGAGWLKVKPTHTLDLVVIAAEWGGGRRRGWLSNLHLAARDPATGGFVMLGKTFKGMTDEVLAWQTTRLQELAVERDAPTVYVQPELVVEVAFDGVQASPQYPGGVALRFARIKRYRPDKTVAEADTIDRVRAIHRT